MQSENLRKEVGIRFKSARKYLGLTQTDLAEILDCSQSKIKDIEGGRFMLTAETAVLFAEKYKISLDWLYLNIGKMFSKNFKK